MSYSYMEWNFYQKEVWDDKVVITIKWFHEKMSIKNWGGWTASEYTGGQQNENNKFSLHS